MPSTRGIRAGKAYVELFADNSKLIRGLKAASAKLKAFGSMVSGLGLKMAGMGAVMMAPLLAASRVFASMGDSVAKMAKRTGVGVEALSELRFVASQTGTDLDTLEKGLRRMQRSVYDAGRGLSTATDGLDDLGLTFKDLDGLAPEEQFKLLGDRLSQVEDPSRKAAIAMGLFGRAGTMLLPMFADGAAGIEKLQAKARALGLTMRGEDAAAAEAFTDAMDGLWKSTKMAVFNLGAALAPVLQDVAERITNLVVASQEWIRQNRGVVVTILQVAAGILAGGIALVILGKGIVLVGMALGGLKMILTGVSAALGVLGSMIGLLLSPIGLVIAAVAAMGAYLLYASGKGGEAIDWLRKKFGVLGTDASEAWEGISAALADGDIGQAAKILWLTLKMEWKRGIAGLAMAWEAFKGWFIKLSYSAFYGAVKVAATVWHGLEVAWIETTSFLAKAWYGFTAFFSRTWEGMKAVAKKSWNWIKSLFDEEIDLEAANRQVDVEYNKAINEIDDEQQRKSAQRELERQKSRTASAKLHETVLSDIDTAHQKRLDALSKGHTDQISAAEAELGAARDEWKAAIAEAKGKRDARDADGGPGTLEGPDALVNKFKNLLAGAGEGVEQARAGVVGTFSGAFASRLGAAGPAAERTAVATEQTAANTRKILEEQRNGLAFG